MICSPCKVTRYVIAALLRWLRLKVEQQKILPDLHYPLHFNSGRRLGFAALRPTDAATHCYQQLSPWLCKSNYPKKNHLIHEKHENIQMRYLAANAHLTSEWLTQQNILFISFSWTNCRFRIIPCSASLHTSYAIFERCIPIVRKTSPNISLVSRLVCTLYRLVWYESTSVRPSGKLCCALWANFTLPCFSP